MQCTEYSKRRQNLTFATLSLTFIYIGHKTFPVLHADRVILSGYPAGQGQPSRIWKVQIVGLANNGKGMLFLVKQAFVGRDEIRAPLKTSAWEARPKQRSKISGISRHHVINLVLEMFAETVIECLVRLAWGFPPRSKLMLRKVFQLAQPLFSQNLLMLKLM